MVVVKLFTRLTSSSFSIVLTPWCPVLNTLLGLLLGQHLSRLTPIGLTRCTTE
ncbi:ORF2b' protein [Southwest baboon virus 1]|uniref:ORF2b' protein n=1 Tax=Southwest baboon virus 1 TaxID=1546178 RepID=UPI0004F9111B|nr:ORF2b' protein [Southwest baboon virus 1]AIP91326.1 ORF2b' protein [Southwest baboon virus 1]AIP91340.1 ORF2b' protein [Southwest baboon virus 1]AIP91354.1 ORF2b' protein [Southwest baboon virus 1]